MHYPTKRLLIVDDKECIRRTLSRVAAGLGFQVRSANNGLSALREIRLENPDFLLSDLNMPGMSGFELLSVVRRRFPAILVIAMSGTFRGSNVPSCVSADAFYQKGSSTSNLAQILRTPPKIRRHTQPDSDCASPLWIQRNPRDSSVTAQARITCPECLRAFYYALDDLGSPTCNVECIHCGYSIQHSTSMVRPLDEIPSRAVRQIAGMAAD